MPGIGERKFSSSNVDQWVQALVDCDASTWLSENDQLADVALGRPLPLRHHLGPGRREVPGGYINRDLWKGMCLDVQGVCQAYRAHI
jgi:hypothetical protein